MPGFLCASKYKYRTIGERNLRLWLNSAIVLLERVVTRQDLKQVGVAAQDGGHEVTKGDVDGAEAGDVGGPDEVVAEAPV